MITTHLVMFSFLNGASDAGGSTVIAQARSIGRLVFSRVWGRVN